MEQRLNGAVERRAARRGGDDGALGSLWAEIRERRNSLAHAGFRPQVVPEPSAAVAGLIDRCERLADDDANWRPAPLGRAGRVLVAPLGLSPGALFTAVRGLWPDRLLVLTSPQARPLLREACERAGWTGEATEHCVADAHNCFSELENVLAWSRATILDAREAAICVTGGTTAMQYLAERVAGDAERFGIPVRRYAAVDRRTLEEQRREPYVPGELLELGGDPRPPDPAVQAGC